MGNWRKNVYAFGIIASIQFYITAIIAMFFYAGGHYNDPSALGYTFWSNYYSDLGSTIAYSGKVNIVSQTMLLISGIIWFILMIAFFCKLPALFEEAKKGKKFCVLGSVLAILSGSAFMGCSFAPLDIYEGIHGIFAGIAYSLLMLMAFSYGLAIYFEKGYSNRYVICLWIMGFVLFSYNVLNAFGPVVGIAPEWLEIYVTAQKIVTCVNTVALSLFSYGAWRFAEGRIE